MDASRRIFLAIGLSLLAHASLLLLKPLAPKFVPPGPMADVPMTVVITPPEVQREPVPPAPETPPAAQPRTAPAPARRSPAVPRTPMPQIPSIPAPSAPATPPPSLADTPRTAPAPTVDMMAEMRAARRAAAEAQRGPPVEAPDAATRNLSSLSGREGVGGVFQILRMSPCSGEFAFNGWRPDARSQWREVIEVESACGSVELAMIRRMIDLIRTHYTGDFNWESHRLQKVVVLSARPADQQELEDFLFREFFGMALENPRHRMR